LAVDLDLALPVPGERGCQLVINFLLLQQARERVGREASPSAGVIVKRSDRSTGFSVLPWRWVVERTFAWLNRNRRLAKDFKATVGSGEAWMYLASVQLLARRLARSTANSVPEIE
jgi:Transposase DDE domain